LVDAGYRAVRVQTAVPGLTGTYGVSADPRAYEPAGSALPTEAVWSTRRYLAHVPGVFERVRAEFGPDLPLRHAAHPRPTPIEAAGLGRALEPYGLTWLEDPVPAELQEGYRLIRQHSLHPPARGVVFT